MIHCSSSEASGLRFMFGVIASRAFLVGIVVLCGLWLHSTMTTSLFSSSTVSWSVRVFTRLGALSFVGGLLLAGCVLGAEDSVPVALGRATGLPVRIADVCDGVLLKVMVSFALLSLRGGTKWHSWRVL
jgi:hypothetical protein